MSTNNNGKESQSMMEIKMIVQQGQFGSVSDTRIKQARTELTPSAAALAKLLGIKNKMSRILASDESKDKILKGDFSELSNQEPEIESNDSGSNVNGNPGNTRTFTFKVPSPITVFVLDEFDKKKDSPEFDQKVEAYLTKRAQLGLNDPGALVGESKARALSELKPYQFGVTTVWLQCTPGEVYKGSSVIKSKKHHFLAGFGYDQAIAFISKFGISASSVKDSNRKRPKGATVEDSKPDEGGNNQPSSG